MKLVEFIYGRSWESRLLVPLIVGLCCTFAAEFVALHRFSFSTDERLKTLLFSMMTFFLWKEWSDWLNG